MRIFSIVASLIAAALTVSTVSAHRPLWGDEAGLTEIPNLTTSFALYRDLTSPEQVDVYTFEGRAGEHLHAGINIPAVAGLEDYEVSVALFGPGLPAPQPEQLPGHYPEELGAVVYASERGEDFFEPFTQTNYWGRQRIELELPATGRYYLLVWNPAAAAGKYVIDVGTEEVFGPADLFRFPAWWLKVHLYFGHGPVIFAAAGVVVIAAAVLGWGWAVRGRATNRLPEASV